MMTPHEALIVADTLRQSYADVCVYAADHPIRVVAKQNIRELRPRVHVHRPRIARNVRGTLRHGKDGGLYLLGPNEKHTVARRYQSVVMCADCEHVLSYDFAVL